MLSQVKVGIMTGAILPGGHPLPRREAVHPGMGSWGRTSGCAAAEQPGAAQSSVGSWEFPFPREETAPILSPAGAKDVDCFFSLLFFFFFSPDESKLTIPLQRRCQEQPERGDSLEAAGTIPKEAAGTRQALPFRGCFLCVTRSQGKPRCVPAATASPGHCCSLLQPPPSTAAWVLSPSSSLRDQRQPRR